MTTPSTDVPSEGALSFPKPWTYHKYDSGVVHVYDANNKGVAKANTLEHAKQIVESVNNFDEMRKALEGLLAAAERAAESRTAGQEQVALMNLLRPCGTARTLLTSLERAKGGMEG